MLTRIAFSLLVLFLPNLTLPQATNPRIAQVENSLLPYVPVEGLKGWNLPERMKFHRVPGLSIAIIHDYKIDWAKAYGLADTTTRKPVTTETMFSAGSISKLVAAVAALNLVEEGKLALDSPINESLKSWKLAENDFTRTTPVTLRMLLSHRGGTSQSAYFGFTPDRTPLPSVVDILSGKPGTDSRPVVVNSAPNGEFRYSGGGYLVAQQTMMDATGQDFASLTKKTVFQKLGMAHTTFAQPLPEPFARNASWAYSSNAWFKGMPYVYPQQAPAGLYSTASDLARLLIDLQNSYRGKKGLLSAASVRAMLTPQALVSDGAYREEIGLGAFLLQRSRNQAPEGRYFEHTGVNAGFLAYFLGSVTGGNGVVILMNNDGGAGELGKEIRRAVAKVYNWPGFLLDEIRPVATATADLDAYAGRYQRSDDEVVTFRREGDYLVETINAGSPILCFPVAPATIAFTDYPLRGRFERSPTGRVDSFRVEGNARAMPRLADDRFVPNELIRLGRIAEAVEGYRRMNLNEYQLTYLAYDFLNQRPANFPAAKGILELARATHPKSSIVYARWAEYYLKTGQKAAAIEASETALTYDPSDQELRKKLAEMKGK